MNAEILTVGTELLLGDILNSNSQFLSRELAAYGIQLLYQSTVGDNNARLKQVLSLALSRSDMVVITGGLGPTPDDLTRETVCEVLDIPLMLHEESWARIQEYFANTGRELSPSNKKQAMLPEGCVVFPNDHGTAPGCAIERDGHVVILLPGPPAELIPMFNDKVAPYLSKFSGGTIFSQTVGVFGIPESTVAERLADPRQRELLARRIESGDGFDDIARLAGWDGILLTSLHCPEDQIYLGKSVAELAEMEHKTPLDACCDLLIREHCQVTMIDFMASEEDIAGILRDPYSSLISDATYPTEGQPHPRVYGSCTRLLEHFVRETGTLTWEQAVHKLTGAPAAALRLRGKGVLAQGADADVCVFDPEKLHERGTYQQPRQTAEGMTLVLVDGQAAVRDGQLTGVMAGRAIRR
mgnify:CR=1 FL=1